MTVSTRRSVRQLRMELRMTQQELGKILGVTGCTVYRWEHGDTRPSRLAREALVRLAADRGLAFESESSTE